MLGFRGHFLTKARRYSVTFGELRSARMRYRAEGWRLIARGDADDSLRNRPSPWWSGGSHSLGGPSRGQPARKREAVHEMR